MKSAVLRQLWRLHLEQFNSDFPSFHNAFVTSVVNQVILKFIVGKSSCVRNAAKQMLPSIIKLEWQVFRTGRRIAPKFCTHARI